ncbi:MAG TPA: clostripain-related cysteine peptidase [Spirochaetota bacterium]|nr:clostripain-related cysteine peptidase [Spirochaetota bacterium]HPI87940.1 clostripain-related cysteine peptidase [Spirochaetota bacterium]HPR46650.1 clostripain-related cysteine peptidase [Spirochaetota bacterium]
MSFTKKITLLLAAAFTAAALIAGVYFYRAASETWTFAFYLNGSQGLLIEQQKNLREIVRGTGAPEHCTVVVYCDRGTAPNAPMLYSWKGARVFHVNGTYSEILSRPLTAGLPRSVEEKRFTGLLLKGIPEEKTRLFNRYYSLAKGRFVLNTQKITSGHEQAMIAALRESGYLGSGSGGTADSATAKSMSRFFSLVRDNFASRHYAFFITGHGQGWFSGAVRYTPSGKQIISRQGPAYRVSDIARGLEFNEPDILCLDLCLMADLESVYELRHSASWLVLGQGPMPAAAQDYEALLRAVRKNSPAGAEAMARTVFASSARSLEKSRLNGSVCLVKTGKELDAFYGSFAQIINDGLMRQKIYDKESGLARLPRWGALAEDMIDARGLINIMNAYSMSELPGVNSFMPESFSTSDRATGLSIYYPADCKSYKKIRDDYAALDFNRATHGAWLQLLNFRCGDDQLSSH